MAVDFVKTGQPARMPRELKPKKWPHFMEKKYKTKEQLYHSKKILGKLYDQVERVDFVAAFEAPFDERIMQAYDLDTKMLQDAAELKSEYDEAMHRVMAQYQIETEFEIWSTLVLHHAQEKGDYKFHEVVGEISTTLKVRFRKACYEKAGGKAFEQIGPFVAAMYTVTSDEISQALKECRAVQMVSGQEQPVRKMVPSSMPLMSFPWLFHGILGKIANGSTCWVAKDKPDTTVEFHETEMLPSEKNHTQSSQLETADDLVTADRVTHRGDVLELFDDLIDYERESQPVVPETLPDPKSSNPSSQAASVAVDDLFSGDSMGEPAKCVNWEAGSTGYSDPQSDNLMDTPIGAGQDSPIQVGQVSSPGQGFFKELIVSSQVSPTKAGHDSSIQVGKVPSPGQGFVKEFIGSFQACKSSSKSGVTPSSSRSNLLVAQKLSVNDSWEAKVLNDKDIIGARASGEDDRANGQPVSSISKSDSIHKGGAQEDKTNPESDSEEEIVHLKTGRTLLDQLIEFNEGSTSS